MILVLRVMGLIDFNLVFEKFGLDMMSSLGLENGIKVFRKTGRATFNSNLFLAKTFKLFIKSLNVFC